MMMFAAVYLEVDISDDDVSLEEVASQCGYDVVHPQVCDVDEPSVANYHGQSCIVLRLNLDNALQGGELEDLLRQAVLKLSHPSVSSVTALGIQACQ
jgi:hypothetical protein